MRLELIPGFCDVEREGRAQAYNEPAFRYFLAIERKRCERSSQPFVLLLLDLNKSLRAAIEPEIEARLFATLSVSLRETDFIGWYREGVTIGAVLTQLIDTPEGGAADQVHQRVIDMLFKTLPSEITDGFQARLYRMPAQAQELGEAQS